MSENKKTEKIVGVKGMNDILPADAPLWELFENTVQTGETASTTVYQP